MPLGNGADVPMSVGAELAKSRATLDVAGHVEQLLVPLLREIGEPAALVGYCLGGTMAIAAANLAPCERVATLAAPWHFRGYPDESRAALKAMWRHSEPAAKAIGALPMEVLQAAFWSLDPARTVTKFAAFGKLDPRSAEARRFVTLEDWANAGEPLPYPAARELIVDLFECDVTGRGEWRVAGKAMTDRPAMPMVHLVAAHDRISPRQAGPEDDNRLIEAGRPRLGIEKTGHWGSSVERTSLGSGSAHGRTAASREADALIWFVASSGRVDPTAPGTPDSGWVGTYTLDSKYVGSSVASWCTWYISNT